jgi:hypothetical protein
MLYTSPPYSVRHKRRTEPLDGQDVMPVSYYDSMAEAILPFKRLKLEEGFSAPGAQPLRSVAKHRSPGHPATTPQQPLPTIPEDLVHGWGGPRTVSPLGALAQSALTIDTAASDEMPDHVFFPDVVDEDAGETEDMGAAPSKGHVKRSHSHSDPGMHGWRTSMDLDDDDGADVEGPPHGRPRAGGDSFRLVLPDLVFKVPPAALSGGPGGGWRPPPPPSGQTYNPYAIVPYRPREDILLQAVASAAAMCEVTEAGSSQDGAAAAASDGQWNPAEEGSSMMEE